MHVIHYWWTRSDEDGTAAIPPELLSFTLGSRPSGVLAFNFGAIPLEHQRRDELMEEMIDFICDRELHGEAGDRLRRELGLPSTGPAMYPKDVLSRVVGDWEVALLKQHSGLPVVETDVSAEWAARASQPGSDWSGQHGAGALRSGRLLLPQ